MPLRYPGKAGAPRKDRNLRTAALSLYFISGLIQNIFCNGMFRFIRLPPPAREGHGPAHLHFGAGTEPV